MTILMVSLSKPLSQITMMEGKLKQNKGWDGGNPETQYKISIV